MTDLDRELYRDHTDHLYNEQCIYKRVSCEFDPLINHTNSRKVKATTYQVQIVNSPIFIGSDRSAKKIRSRHDKRYARRKYKTNMALQQQYNNHNCCRRKTETRATASVRQSRCFVTGEEGCTNIAEVSEKNQVWVPAVAVSYGFLFEVQTCFFFLPQSCLWPHFWTRVGRYSFLWSVWGKKKRHFFFVW